MAAAWLFKFWNFYPPFLGAGIRIKHISDDFLRMEVELEKRPWTSNYIGVQFGGSIYMMTDPFLAVMFIQKLGRKHLITDKAATIRYRRPGKTKLRCVFELTEAEVQGCLEAVERDGKHDWKKMLLVTDTDGEVVAEVEKTIHFRKRERPPV